jgi:DNA-binding ferritin-like protein
MNELPKLISFLLHSRTQTHIFHWQTKSFAEHMALNTYYDEIVELIDGLVESYQGRNGIITGYSNFNLLEYTSCEEVIAYFQGLNNTIEKLRQGVSQDSYIQNQIDTIVELVESTAYKLQFLK